MIVLDLSQDISSTTTSTTTTTATTDSPIGVGNNVLSGKTNKQKTFFLLNFHVSLSKYCNSLDPKSPALSNLKFLANLIFLSINNLFKNLNTLVNRFVELIIYLQKNPKLLKLGQFKSFSSSKQLLSELDLGVQGIVLLKLCYLIPRNQLLKKKLMLNLLF